MTGLRVYMYEVCSVENRTIQFTGKPYTVQ